MSNKVIKVLKRALCYAVMAAMVVTFIPLNRAEVSAATFSTGSKVTGVAVADKGYNYVKLSWSAYDGATAYQVYRATSKNGKYTKRDNTEDLTYKDKGTHNKTYYYKVRAYYKKNSNADTQYGKFSSPVKAKMTLKKPNVSVTLYSEKIQLNWDKVSDATGYQVKRATSKNGSYKAMKNTKDLYKINTKIEKKKYYYYKVRAYKVVSGKTYYGPYCSPMKARTKLPGPKSPKVEAASSGLQLYWTDIRAAKGFEIYRATSADGSYTKLATLKSDNYLDKTAEKGTQYFYKVRGYLEMNDTSYFGDYCSTVSGKRPAANSDGPVVTMTPQSGCVELSWPAVSGVTGYEVYRATSENGTYKKLGINTKSPTWTNDELTLNTIYYYKVRTYTTKSGSTTYGPYSDPVAGMTKVETPTDLKGSAGSSSISLSWSASPNASGYEVSRATSQNGTYSSVGTSRATSFTDTKSLTKNTTYYYKVRGYINLNGQTYYGDYSSTSPSRDKVISVALAWEGVKEGSSEHHKIIDLYNSNLAAGCGKMTYSLAWCAAFVSAVGIKAKATDVIVRHSYCPTMLSTYKKRGQTSYNKSYAPKAADIIFFDWNKNGNPDHVGMVVSCVGSTVTTIEGNKNDRVETRKFSKGYTYVQAYGLPPYSEKNTGIVYGGTSTASVSTSEAINKSIKAAGISPGDPNGYGEMGNDYDTAEKKLSVGCGGDSTEMDKMKLMIKTMKKEADTADLDGCTKSEYQAAFLYRLCQDADVEACLVTSEDEDGNKIAWIEVTLDGQLYKVDPSKDDCQPVKYTPEVTDCKNPA
ncbi:MAG: CHAP domain-containing protein [Bacillota bacterium]|nr:CHAP domain-containing protein [Bacillota bacterium]